MCDCDSSPPLPSSTEVCIVGAGPSGLACALGLAARKIPFVIVDAVAEGHTASRAIVIYPGALESIGALDPQVAEDIMATGTKYPFGMFMAQHTVEEAMRAGIHRSGSGIHFGKRMEAIEEVDDGAQYELLFESGERLRARYIVATDGAKSSLRSFAGITFRDPYTKKEAAPGAQDSNFIVSDVVFEKPTESVARDALQLSLVEDGFLLTGPLKDPVDPGLHLFRLYIGMTGTPPRNADLAYLQGVLDAQFPGSKTTPRNVPSIAKVLHAARFRTRPALADSYLHRTKGGAYILLAGDAAHTHGPGGRQGMNLGICDGASLALAIDKHRTASLETKGDARQILESYAKTRREVGWGVIDTVQDMENLEAGGLSWARWFRIMAVRILSPVPFVNNLMAWQTSGLGYAA
ncbi:FAD/NAD(P)-binding domain-containing protein [Roridomyces roridus]|uniref:FAD/NAD(P)-binding domain-containing protein n=1 Tax=Roridomyces roridus TaxID=1738132 RepID=A0AAD7BCY8_9AGAR|nr:FAD/NAD(P)-binding domain-containing protein [Roridomyces roridus]